MVVMSGDEHKNSRKGSGKRRDLVSSLKKIVSITVFTLLMICFTELCLFYLYRTWYRIQVLVVHGSTPRS